MSGPAPARDSSRARQAMAEAVSRMTAVLREENAALEAMDFARAGQFLAPKQAAAEALASAWQAAEQEPAMSRAMQDLALLADENRQRLVRAMRVQRRVLDLVARAAKAVQPPAGYTANGRMRASRTEHQNFKTRV